MWPVIMGGEDKEGHLILLDDLGSINFKGLQKMYQDSPDSLVLQRARMMELVELRKRRRAEETGRRRYKQVVIFDLAALSFSHLTSENRTIVGSMIKKMQALYVESTWKIFVINAPMIFRGAWAFVKTVLAARTVEKVNICGGKSSYMSAFENAGILPESVPEKIGGSFPNVDCVSTLTKELRKEGNNPVSIPQLAKKIGLSHRQLNRRFKEATGLSPQQFQIRVKIEKACKLLRDTEKALVEIGLELGFCDQSAFTAQFRKRMSMTPRQYRTQYGRNRSSVS